MGTNQPVKGHHVKPPRSDWHRADIVASLKKIGLSLRTLSTRNRYKPDTLKKALRTRYPKGERIIADALGLRPETIWPSRYQSESSKSHAHHRS